MGVGAGLYMCDVVKKSSRSLSHLLMSSCFVCVGNISGTTERICAKFTRKTCLVRRLEEFEGQVQMSKVKVTRDKTAFFRPFWRPACGLCRKTSLAFFSAFGFRAID